VAILAQEEGGKWCSRGQKKRKKKFEGEKNRNKKNCKKAAKKHGNGNKRSGLRPLSTLALLSPVLSTSLSPPFLLDFSRNHCKQRKESPLSKTVKETCNGTEIQDPEKTHALLSVTPNVSCSILLSTPYLRIHFSTHRNSYTTYSTPFFSSPKY